MTLIHVKNSNDGKNPLIIKDEHFEFMKWSKAKSIRIDWLMLQLIQYDHFLGTERMSALLESGPAMNLSLHFYHQKSRKK